MEPLGVTASIVGLAAATLKVIKYVSSVKDTSSERRALKVECEGLLQLLPSLQSTLDDAAQSATCFDGIKILIAPKGPLDQLREALEQLNKKVEPKKSAKDYARALTWSLDKDHCIEVLGKLERVKSSIGIALQSNSHQLLRTTQEDVANLRNKEDESRRHKILDWFSPLNFFKTQQDVFKKRQKDTGLWFIESQQFQEWLAGPTKTLCCVGIPGAGKSVLASIVVEHLRNEHRRGPRGKGRSIGVAVAYCSFKETKTHDTENLLAGLGVQIADNIPIPETLTKLHESHQNKQTRPTLKEICGVVSELAKSFDDLYLIIDALDECPTEARTVLIRELKVLPSKLLVTTRPIDGIIRQFDGSPIVEIRASDNDLRKYILSRLESSGRLSALLRGNDTLAADIRQKIIAKANGMFLAAELHMNSLSCKMSVKALKKAIEDLPKTLNQLYDDAFQRIDDQTEDDKEIAYKALRWVAYAYRPMKVQMLEEILAVDTESQDFDCEAMPLLGLVLDVCAGLLIIDEQTQHVRLVHYTTQDYFDAHVASRFKDAHELIARDCITFLSYDTFQCPPVFEEDDDSLGGSDDMQPFGYSYSAESGDNDLDDTEDNNGPLRRWKRKYHLLPYASYFWARHAVAGGQINLSARINAYLASNPRVWLNIFKYVYVNRRRTPETLAADDLDECTSCGLAAYFGLCGALKLILSITDNINMLTYGGRSPLHLAADSDQSAAIEILLEHGADIESKASVDCVNSVTPLLLSITSGSQTAARVLLDHGADPMCHDDYGDTPFATVAWNSPIPILEQLLKCGADIDCTSSEGTTQLMHRARRNDTQTLQWLLEHGASINLKDADGDTALSIALLGGLVESAQALIDYGADLTMLDRRGCTTLHQACRHRSSSASVKYLLDEGISIDAVNDNGHTALHYAVLFDCGEAVDLLLANHAEMDKVSDNGRTPLMEAVNKGSADAIIALLEAGANVNVQNHFGFTALHFAAAAANGNLAAFSGRLKSSAIRATRSQMMLSITYVAELILNWDLNTYISSEQTLAKHNDDVISHPQRTNHIVGVCFFPRQRLQNLDPWMAQAIMGEFVEIQECRIWANGITALDIADILKKTDCISLLEKLPGMGRSEYSTTDLGEYMADLFGLPNFEVVLWKNWTDANLRIGKEVTPEEPPEERLVEEERYDEAETKEAETAAETD